MSCSKEHEEMLNRIRNLPKQEFSKEFQLATKQFELFKEKIEKVRSDNDETN